MKINYIPDEEISLIENEDLLGTKPYAETIAETIRHAKKSMNIGIFGSWGSGKSTIIRTVKDIFKAEEKETIFFTYDAWKYSKDSFRRTFIIKLVETFNLKYNEILHEILYQETTEEKPGKVRTNWNIFLKLLPAIPFIVALFFILPFLEITTDKKAIIALLGLGFSITSFILKDFFLNYKISVKKSALFAPEQFEKVFIEIVDSILNKKSVLTYIKNVFSKKKDRKKLVIIIDNIDRCHEELVIELLLTIKNFLEK